jgi:hypothetical protein
MHPLDFFPFLFSAFLPYPLFEVRGQSMQPLLLLLFSAFLPNPFLRSRPDHAAFLLLHPSLLPFLPYPLIEVRGHIMQPLLLLLLFIVFFYLLQAPLQGLEVCSQASQPPILFILLFSTALLTVS